jgi:hypothetical protein
LFRMTSLASVILSGAKNLNSCRALAHKSQTDPLPKGWEWCPLSKKCSILAPAPQRCVP